MLCTVGAGSIRLVEELDSLIILSNTVGTIGSKVEML